MTHPSKRPPGVRTAPDGHRPAGAAALIVLAIGLALAPTAGAATTAIGSALALVDRFYLFDAEIEPGRILGEALATLEREIAAFHVEPAGERRFLAAVGRCELLVEAPPAGGARSLERALTQVLELVDACGEERAADAPSPHILALNGALSALDPYSTILEGSRQTEHRIQFSGKLAGIGARIGLRDGKLVLVKVYEGSPADRAGLRDDDVVVRIGDLSTTNIQVTDAVERIRGDVGTQITLTIDRHSDDTVQEVTVTRGLVTIPSVTAELLEGGIVHAVISHYSQTTPQDFRERVGELVNRGSVRGVVIDVRTNSGGSMLGSASIADQFLSDGVLITTAGRGGRSVSGLSGEIRATLDTPLEALPVAVLTSNRTASGSELMAASLRNHDRAILVGERTFGKGTVQKTFGIGGGAIAKITVGHFLPNGQPIPGGGLVPDVEVAVYRLGSKANYLPDRLPEDLPYWLRSPEWADVAERRPAVTVPAVVHLPDAAAGEEAEDEGETADDDSSSDGETEAPADMALELAATILRRFPSTSAARMLDFARVILAERLTEADAELQRAVEETGVDWSPGPRGPGEIRLEAVVDTSAGLIAGVESVLKARLTNRGDEPLRRVRGVLESTAGVFNRRGLLFGSLEPGASTEALLRIEPSLRSKTGRSEFSLHVFDDEGRLTELGPYFVAVEAAPQPRIRFRTQIAAGGEPDLLRVAVEVMNVGEGEANELDVMLAQDLDGEYELLDGRSSIEKLGAGETEKLEFRVKMRSSYEEPRTAKLSLVSARSDVVLETELALVEEPAMREWMEAPKITLAAIEPTSEEGGFVVRATVEDASGLEDVLARVDGDQVAWMASGADLATSVNLSLPWRPADGVKRYEISAVDREGLRSVFITGM